jgi:hypothetical protein
MKCMATGAVRESRAVGHGLGRGTIVTMVTKVLLTTVALCGWPGVVTAIISTKTGIAEAVTPPEFSNCSMLNESVPLFLSSVPGFK